MLDIDSRKVGEAPEKKKTPGKPLGWLHLSDLHISKSWQQDVVLNKLHQDLPALVKKNAVKPSLVFVTGDIANRGTSEQYTIAREFFEELMKELDLDPKKQLFIVPGNHGTGKSRCGRKCHRTLWMWPWGDHWKRLAEGPVPEHYLPAHFWHLCAALRHPEDQERHLAAAEACLDRSDWPELATMLREHMVRPTPQEIKDLFTFGDEEG